MLYGEFSNEKVRLVPQRLAPSRRFSACIILELYGEVVRAIRPSSFMFILIFPFRFLDEVIQRSDAQRNPVRANDAGPCPIITRILSSNAETGFEPASAIIRQPIDII